jgi:hypothetical protein
MPVMARSPLARIALLATLLALAAPAGADAKRKVPSGWVGVNWDAAISQAPDPVQATQFPRMAAAGVETMRAMFTWSAGQPTRKGALDYSETDRIVQLAAARRIRVLPVFILAPRWARRFPGRPFSPPKRPKDMRRYVHALIDRYGAKGSFWKSHPGLPRLPIRAWEFWNEPQFYEFWSIPGDWNWYSSYARFLKAFYADVKGRDRKARVVLGGLTNQSWDRLRELYSAGAGPHFDIVDLHPFTAKPANVVTIIRYVRKQMSKRHDGRKAVLIGEFSRPAAKGHVPGSPNLETSDSGMAKFLTGAFRELAKVRRKLRISRVYWYTWASSYRGDQSIFEYAGLLKYGEGDAAPTTRPAYSAYVSAARKLEGCRKRSSGRCR